MNLHTLLVQNITKRIGDKTLLQDISLELSGGNVYGFSGENGSGKTMLFRVLSGLVKPTEGQVLLDGHDIHRDKHLSNIGIIIENSSLWPELTGFENLLYLSELNKRISKQEVKDALKRVGLNPGNRLPIKKYSLGMKQRLNIAQAIMERPDFIFLDEPTNSIDSDGVVLVRRIISEESARGAVVLLTSHISQDISSLCQQVYQVKAGKCYLAEGV